LGSVAGVLAQRTRGPEAMAIDHSLRPSRINITSVPRRQSALLTGQREVCVIFQMAIKLVSPIVRAVLIYVTWYRINLTSLASDSRPRIIVLICFVRAWIHFVLYLFINFRPPQTQIALLECRWHWMEMLANHFICTHNAGSQHSVWI